MSTGIYICIYIYTPTRQAPPPYASRLGKRGIRQPYILLRCRLHLTQRCPIRHERLDACDR